jgi:hypothetical protein
VREGSTSGQTLPRPPRRLWLPATVVIGALGLGALLAVMVSRGANDTPETRAAPVGAPPPTPVVAPLRDEPPPVDAAPPAEVEPENPAADGTKPATDHAKPRPKSKSRKAKPATNDLYDHRK